ncbi:MAG: CBS domain-containing protein [Pseudomonadota bacterium]
MPTSYQPPPQDGPKQDSKSQTVSLSTKNPTVADVLSVKGAGVFSISPDATLHNAVEQLRDRQIGALLVTDGQGALVGILSERDIVRRLAETPGQTLPQTVRSIMTEKVETCAPSDSTVLALKRMTAGRYRHMPVVDQGKLLGMVTIGDVINHRLTQLEREALQLKQLIVG